MILKGKGHMSFLHLLGCIRVGGIRLLKGGDVSPISECRFLLLRIHFPWKVNWDAVLCYVADEQGRWMRS